MKHSRRGDVGVPLGVFVQWSEWLDAGEVAKVQADLRALIRDVDAPDPPSSVDPPISTR